MITKQELVLSRVFDAPRDLVFRVWTDPNHVKQWWGPHGFTNPVCIWDARPGGKIWVHMEGPDGTIYPMSGTFREVEAPHRLVFLCVAEDDDRNPLLESLTTVTFADVDGKTEITIHADATGFTAMAEAMLGGMSQGWTESLERLQESVDFAGKDYDREIVITRVFDAPREMVFRAMADPAQVVKWWGPTGFTTTILEMDVRPGGIWRQVMKGPDGTEYPGRSDFLEVVEPERIVYDLGCDTEGAPPICRSTWLFTEQGDKTHVTMTGVFPTALDRLNAIQRVGADKGGEQTLACLAEYLEGLSV